MDITNDQAVGVNGIGEIIVRQPHQRMSIPEALRHAAWIVTKADPTGDLFPEVLAAVQSG